MKYILTLLLTATALFSAAQQLQAPFQFKTAVSFNPLVLAPVDNTAMLGAEYRLQNRLALVLDAGYIFYSRYFTRYELKGINGFTFRPGVKHYNKDADQFYQFQISYKQVNYKLHDWLGKACVAGIPTYEQWQSFTYRKKTLSFNMLAGQLFRFSDAVLLELYAGFGVKVKEQQPTERDACYRNNERDFIYSQFREHAVSANLPLGIKILVAVH